jgi:cholesterol transport system auxiliary component
MKALSVSVLLLAAVLAGCSAFKSNAPVEQVYVLRPAAAVAATAPVPGGLLVLRPAVDAALDSPRIALVRPGNRMDYYASARWGGSLSEVLQSLLGQRLRASGVFGVVDTDRGGFGAQYALSVTVRRFEAEYGADPEAAPVARVSLECTLADRGARRTLVSFDVATSAPAEANRRGAVVAALEQAANEAITQVIQRSASAVATAQPR